MREFELRDRTVGQGSKLGYLPDPDKPTMAPTQQVGVELLSSV